MNGWIIALGVLISMGVAVLFVSRRMAGENERSNRIRLRDRLEEMNFRKKAIDACAAALESASQKAGIEADVQRARNSSGGQREKYRAIYFAVPDIDLRKELIQAHVGFDSAIRNYNDAVVAKSKQFLIVARENAESGPIPWFVAGTVAVIVVAAGGAFFSEVGAIGGAVFGFFIGQGIIYSAKRNRIRGLRAAEQEVQALTDGPQQEGLGYFSEAEARKGTPDSRA
jgi:hypothetical protein